jgi:hypothetical protein
MLIPFLAAIYLLAIYLILIFIQRMIQRNAKLTPNSTRHLT